MILSSTRCVILTRRYAIKFPRFESWRQFLSGLLANMQERIWSKAKIDGICPVVCADRFGFLLVMLRARPLNDDEYNAFDAKAFCYRDNYTIPAEHKRDSFGIINDKIVAIDYGVYLPLMEGSNQWPKH
jgi:hypothetical protein